MVALTPQSDFSEAAILVAPIEVSSDDFEANWQVGRGFHNAGCIEQALPHIEKAYAIDPDHSKAHGRLIELYLDMHDKYPQSGYDISALQLSSLLIQKEDSDFAHDLYDCATGHVGLRGLQDSIVRNLD